MNSDRHRIDESNGDIKERNLDWKRDLDFPLDTLRENSDSKIVVEKIEEEFYSLL